jgi:hypothetical protein
MLNSREEPDLRQFLRKVPGSSQAFLAEATDGFQYVVKFASSLQGPNLPFNEAVGHELYRSANLPTPAWRPLRITESFIAQNLGCWLETPCGPIPPPAGLCFGSGYLGGGSLRVYQLLPGSHYRRVRNREDFSLAWLLDICARHTDNRQAVFCEGMDARLCAVFIDFGHMFGGPAGTGEPRLIESAYLDTRVYQTLPADRVKKFKKAVLDIKSDRVWRKALMLPAEWKTDSALTRLSECLNSLSSSQVVENVFVAQNLLLNGTHLSDTDDARPPTKATTSVLRPRLQSAAEPRFIVA